MAHLEAQFECTPIGEIDRLKSEIARLTAELEESRAGEEGALMIIASERSEVLALRRQLDEARASAAAAYERAAQVADACEKQNSPKISDYHKGLSSGGQAIAAGIRALSTEAESNALAEMLNAETRACAKIVRDNGMSSMAGEKAILARIDQRKEAGE